MFCSVSQGCHNFVSPFRCKPSCARYHWFYHLCSFYWDWHPALSKRYSHSIFQIWCIALLSCFESAQFYFATSCSWYQHYSLAFFHGLLSHWGGHYTLPTFFFLESVKCSSFLLTKYIGIICDMWCPGVETFGNWRADSFWILNFCQHWVRSCSFDRFFR